MKRRVVRGLFLSLFGAIAGVGVVPACVSGSGASGDYCENVVARLRTCGIIGEGRYEACANYEDSPEPCETRCIRGASCSEMEQWTCDGTGAVSVCFGRCIGLEPFECGGQRLSGYARCNGVDECPEGRDEIGCDVIGPPCRTGGGRVTPEQWCDGKEDCEDGSDENPDCEVVTPCDGGVAIVRSMYCNGVADCEDGADEPEGCATRELECGGAILDE